MSISTMKAEAVDADITRLFEKYDQYTSPNDLDKRILEAATLAVRDVKNDTAHTRIVIKRRVYMFMFALALLLIITL